MIFLCNLLCYVSAYLIRCNYLYDPLFIVKQIPSDGFRAVPKLRILDLSGAVGALPENPAFSSLPELEELYLRFVLKIGSTNFSCECYKLLALTT